MAEGSNESLGKDSLNALAAIGYPHEWVERGLKRGISFTAPQENPILTPAVSQASATVAEPNLMALLQSLQRVAVPLDDERRARLIADVSKVLDAYR